MTDSIETHSETVDVPTTSSEVTDLHEPQPNQLLPQNPDIRPREALQILSGKNTLNSQPEHISPEVAEKLNAYQRLVQEQATAIYSEFLPQRMPSEETRVLMTLPDQSMSISELGAQYLGKVKDEHLIYFPVNMTPFDLDSALSTGKANLDHVIVLVHELAHQKHAEHVGQKAFESDIEATFEDKEVSEMTPDQIADVANQAAGTDIFNTLTITNAVREGVAVMTEMVIMDKMIKKAHENNEMRTVTELQQRRAMYIDLMRREVNFSRRTGQACLNSYVAGSFDIARKLYMKLGVEGALQQMEKVDLQSCSKVRYGDPEYASLLEDPFQLPLTE